MKKLLFLPIIRLIVIFSLLNFCGCQRPDSVVSPKTDSEPTAQNVTVEEAKTWFEQQSINHPNARSTRKFAKNPHWKSARQVKFNGADAVVVMFEPDENSYRPRIRNGKTKDKLTDADDPIGLDDFSDLLVYQKDGKKIAEIVTRIPDEVFFKQKNKSEWKFSGLLFISDLDDNFIRGFRFDNGIYQHDVSLNKPKNAGARSANGSVNSYPCPVYTIDWYCLVCAWGDCSLNYNYTDTVWGTCDSGQGSSYSSATGYFGAGGGNDGSDGTSVEEHTAIIQVDADKPIVSPYQQAKCFLNNTDDYTYKLTIYVDQPGDNQDVSWFWGSGHVFVGLSKTSRNDGSAIERTFGFYPNNTYLAITGAAGTLHTNEGTEYDVSIMYPISPQQMASVANAVLDNGSHQYILTDYNCSDFAKSICNAAGVWIPVESQRIYLDNSTLWIHSPGKLGGALRRASSSNPNIVVRPADQPLKATTNKGDCQ